MLPYHNTDWAQQLGYQWGAFGHPLKVGSTSVLGSGMPTDFQYDTLGWDDDTVLFTVNPAGQIDDVKIGDFADYVPSAPSSSLTVWDREIGGQVRGCHNGGGVASASSGAFQTPTLGCGWNEFNPVSFVAPTSSVTTNHAIGHGGMLLIPKDDGFSDGQNTFQGVRTYDPQAGVWTTPDAFRGDVHDPMTQKPYMWNGNNPFAYSDPSGYCAIAQPQTCAPQIVSGVITAARILVSALGSAAATAGGAVVVLLSLSGDEPERHGPRLEIAPGREKHILEGDETGGGHAPGAGKPGKSEWPAGTSDEEILRDVRDVANDPRSKRTEQSNGNIAIEGTRDGVHVKVIFKPGEGIISAFPTNTPRNPK